MKVSCGITLYHPTKNELSKIELYSNIFEIVYIIDNTPVNSVLDTKCLPVNSCVLSENENLGLSKSLNMLCSKALSDGFIFLCLLDQDSVFDVLSINQIVKVINENENENVGIFSPRIIYSHKNEYRFNSLTEPILWAITSGSFINLNAFKVVGKFDENYFIDRIEYDYCELLRENGFDIIQVNNATLNQSLGNVKCIYNKEIYQHSPLRNYYQFRNRAYFYLFKSRRTIFYNIWRFASGSAAQILKIIVFEDQKIKKIGYIVKAFCHLFKGNYGQFRG